MNLRQKYDGLRNYRAIFSVLIFANLASDAAASDAASVMDCFVLHFSSFLLVKGNNRRASVQPLHCVLHGALFGVLGQLAFCSLVLSVFSGFLPAAANAQTVKNKFVAAAVTGSDGFLNIYSEDPFG